MRPTSSAFGDLLKRKPRQLSGGQRQRVALGRAIVRHPRVFLFDEPLSNLDAKLRVQMRVELKKLHLRLGTTAIYVTHDQVEAMTLGDRVVVMKDGLVQQVGEPLELYNQPANRFVAGFIGSPAMNFAKVTMTDGNGRLTAKNGGMEIEVPAALADRLRPHVGQQLTLGIRPEDLHVATDRRSARPHVQLQGRGGRAAGLGDPARRARRRGQHGGGSRPDRARQGDRISCGSRSIRSACTSSTPRPRRRSELGLAQSLADHTGPVSFPRRGAQSGSDAFAYQLVRWATKAIVSRRASASGPKAASAAFASALSAASRDLASATPSTDTSVALLSSLPVALPSVAASPSTSSRSSAIWKAAPSRSP